MNLSKYFSVMTLCMLFTLFIGISLFSEDLTVTVFSQYSYTGQSKAYTESVPDLAASGYTEKVRSIKLSINGRIALFGSENFQGKCLELRGDIPNVTSTSFKFTQVKSIQFNAHCPPPTITAPIQLPTEKASLYEDIDLRGKKLILADDVSDLSAVGFNDKASSLKVNPGQVVSLYEDKHYKGKCVTYRRNSYNLGGANDIGNDKVSSVKFDHECPVSLTFKNDTTDKMYASGNHSLGRHELLPGQSYTGLVNKGVEMIVHFEYTSSREKRCVASFKITSDTTVTTNIAYKAISKYEDNKCEVIHHN